MNKEHLSFVMSWLMHHDMWEPGWERANVDGLEKNIRFHRWILMHRCALKQMLSIICINNAFHFTRGAPLHPNAADLMRTAFIGQQFRNNLKPPRGPFPFMRWCWSITPLRMLFKHAYSNIPSRKTLRYWPVFSCPAALLLFSEKEQPRRRALEPLCSVQLSWLKPQGSFYLAIDSLLLKFGPVCVTIYLFIPTFFIGEFRILLLSLLLFPSIRISDLWQKKNTQSKKQNSIFATVIFLGGPTYWPEKALHYAGTFQFPLSGLT